MNYWLLKTEPHSYSIKDLKRDRVGKWDGVRNYQARNYLRKMMKGDRAFIYHSNTAVPAIVGLCRITKGGYPDSTALDPASEKFDPKSTQENPRWYMVDIEFEKEFKEPITLAQLKPDHRFDDMLLTQKGIRLSVQPVKEKHFEAILKLAKV